jgi:CheY-like chemotaxis protein
VLIIEDNQDSADMLAMYLGFVGHQVQVAADGPSGLRAAFEMNPTVIVCDIGLPGMNGYQVAQSLRAVPALAGCMLIALTGYGDAAAREQAERAGFTHHLTKPADPAKLAELVAQVESA